MSTLQLSAPARAAWLLGACLVLANLVACKEGDDTEKQPAPLTREELLDPESCKQCHEKHVTEWSASMHAYASKDPVFLAMNERGQEETDGGLGDFCVNCHAPMAVREDAFANGDFTDFEQVPDHLEGVTCYFCHNVVDVEKDHDSGLFANNGLVLADDTTMRGGIADPVEPWAHGAEGTEHFDATKPESSRMCGSCHDIVTPNGVHLERTYDEYQKTIFATSPDPVTRQSCIDCHMDPTDFDETIADYPGVRARPRHEHLWPGVDVPLTAFPHREAMVSAVERDELPQSIVFFTVNPTQGAQLELLISIETGAGHRQPSGAAQDRRMWLEWTAYDWADQVIAESGTIADDELETGHDKIVLIGDTLFADEAKTIETHMFWNAKAFSARTIPEPTTPIAGDHAFPIKITLPVTAPPKRVEFTLRMRPMGLDVLQDLADSGHLDPAIMQEMPTFTVRSETAEWSDPEDVTSFTLTTHDDFVDPRDYRCKLFPKGSDCD
jgi:hypothetical protein